MSPRERKRDAEGRVVRGPSTFNLGGLGVILMRIHDSEQPSD